MVKISYKYINRTYECNPLLDMYMLPKLIQFMGILGGIHLCIKIGSKCFFYINVPFVIPLNNKYLDDLCID